MVVELWSARQKSGLAQTRPPEAGSRRSWFPKPPQNMSTPSKAKARRRAKNMRPAWLAAKRRPRGSPAADYTHPINKALGRAIRAWRLAHGLTVSRVAKLAQLARDTVAEIERGQAWFSWNAAARVCDAMGVCLTVMACEAMRRCGRLPRQKCRV